MRGKNSRGAKFSITSMADLLKILVLEKDIDFHILIAQAAEEFERGNEKYERTRIVKTPQKIKEHIEKEILSDKSLGSIICYIFSSEENSDLILEKMVNLFKIISIKEKRSHREKLNDLISKNIERKNSIIANTEFFSPDVNIFINQNWKINVESDEQIVTEKENLDEYITVKSDTDEFKSTNEINKKEEILNEPKKREKKRSFRWAYILTSILGVLLVLYLVFIQLGGKLIAPIEKAMTENIKGVFDPDPSGNGFGFLSINFTDENNTANLYDSTRIPPLKTGESFVFFVFIDFHNMGIIDIEDARGKINFTVNSSQNILTINAELSGKNVSSIYDTSTILDYTSNHQINFIQGRIENSHYKSDKDYCAGYQYNIEIGEELINEGVSLDVLDAYLEGWCDQGYIIAQFEITNKN